MGKEASKAKSAVSAARHFMSMSQNLSEDVKAQAEDLIEDRPLLTITITRSGRKGEKLNKLLDS